MGCGGSKVADVVAKPVELVGGAVDATKNVASSAAGAVGGAAKGAAEKAVSLGSAVLPGGGQEEVVPEPFQYGKSSVTVMKTGEF